MSKYANIEAVKNYVELARTQLINLGFHELFDTKIVTEWNTRAKNRLGQCCPKRSLDGKRYFLLNFNKKYFEVGDDINVQGTIIHEVAHCVTNGLSHEHSSGWYRAITKYNAVYGTHIRRCSYDLNYHKYLNQQAKLSSNYKIYCDCCKKVVKTYQRNCSTVQGIRSNPSAWRCGGCGKTGTLKLLS
jgi:hypothetical protein